MSVILIVIAEGLALSVLPRRIVDFGYDAVGRVRRRVYTAPEGLCPVGAPALRKRFVA